MSIPPDFRGLLWRLLPALFVAMIWTPRAAAEPAPIAPKLPAPSDTGVYAAVEPLPAGLVAESVIDHGGLRYRCPQPTFEQARCMQRPGLVAAWSGQVGSRQQHVDVEVSVLASVSATGDDAWVRALSRGSDARHVRVYREAGKRIAEGQMQWGGREQDPIWTLTRYVERDGYVLQVVIRVPGVPNAVLIAALRRSFIDAPAAAKPAPAGITAPSPAATAKAKVARRGKVWPFHPWNRAEAVRFNEFPMRPAIPLYAYDEDGLSPHIVEKIPISVPLAGRAVALLLRTRGAVAVSKCPFPRHAVILYDGDVAVASINVCFSCGDILVWPRWDAVPEPDWDHMTPQRQKAYDAANKTTMAAYEQTFPLWKSYFRDQIGFAIDATYH